MAKIIIIGAGFAGLAAANTLNVNGHETVILEGRDRIGGRIWTDYSFKVPFELGAFIIHGVEGNPITQLADQLGIAHHEMGFGPIHFGKQEISLSDEEFEKLWDQYEQLCLDARDYAKAQATDLSLAQAIQAIFKAQTYPTLDHWLNWKLLFQGIYSGAEPKYLSARHWNEDETELPGGHHLMQGGYLPLVQHLAQGQNIHFEQTVHRIKLQNHGVIVSTDKDDFHADAVIITVPLGVLKSGKIQFDPPLPETTQQAINRLEMGVLDKILLQFDAVYWPNEYALFTQLSDKYTEISWYINYGHHFQQPVVIGHMAGDMAKQMGALSNKELCQEAVSALSKLIGKSLPDPIGYRRTNWSRDPFSLGSYSYIPVGASGSDYDILAQPIENKIFFAGEATHRQFPGTTHGAYLSGVRVAERILKGF